MLAPGFILVAVALRLAAGAGYAVAVVRGRARPNPVTWLCWGLAPLVAFAAQVPDDLDAAAWMTLLLAAGPLVIFALSVLRQRSWGSVTAFDVACGLLAAAGVAAWQATDNPAVAVLFAIAADLAGATPTLRAAYRHPYDECAPPYLLSAASMVVTLLTLTDAAFTGYAFPAYILAVNTALFGLIVLGRAGLTSPAYVPFVERTVDADRDVHGDPLDGGRDYLLTVAAHPRSRMTWTVTAYAAGTGRRIDAVRLDADPRATHPLGDGALDVHVGPTRPAAGATWIPTAAGHGWFAEVRAYGPDLPYADRTWTLAAIAPAGQAIS
jgi:uncharacterized protein DUF1214